MNLYDVEFTYSRGDLHYFGLGSQLKISKLGDTLYSSLRDVFSFVIDEMAKESDKEYKYQMPKHTSFVGSIIKVLPTNMLHIRMLQST